MLTSQQIREIFASRKAIITEDHFVYAQKQDGWYHGSAYVNKDAIYPDEEATSMLCRELAVHFEEKTIGAVVGPTVGGVALSQWTTHWLNHMPLQIHRRKMAGAERICAVCADEEDVLETRIWTKPALLGPSPGIFSAFGKVEVSFDNVGRLERISYQAKVGTRRVIKRGYGQRVEGKQCLVVEDVINSGATVMKTCNAVNDAGGIVVGVGALCNRSGGKVTAGTLQVPELFSLLDVNMEMLKEDDEGFCSICREKGRGSVRLDLGKGKEFLARLGLNPGDK